MGMRLRHRTSGLRIKDVLQACPRDVPEPPSTANGQPPAATCEPEADVRFELAANAREHPRNA